MARILCVDDEAGSLAVIEEALKEVEHQTVGVRNVEAALNVLSRGGIDLIVCDYRMPGATGLEFLSTMEKEGIDVPLIMITGFGSIEHAVASIKAGAVDYITKPARPQQLQLSVEQALELVRLRKENAQLREEVGRMRGATEIVGDSAAMRRIYDTLAMVAPTRATVLLQGESGTGKELLARTLHDMSDRNEGPFIAVNAAALPENLVESTLFGHEKGAFTGAVKTMKGAFERANFGTLLLDEISEMRPDLQAKLLRALQEQEFERVGGTVPIRVDIRIVATTNRDLAKEVESGRFREDLFYRLSGVPIRIPPLRERLEDIPLLVSHFAKRAAAENGKEFSGVAPRTIEVLQRYAWPGNVRELSHDVERAVILGESEVLVPEAFDRNRFGLIASLPEQSAPVGASTHSAGAADGETPTPRIFLDSFDLENAEKVLIQKALDATSNNRTKAAELLGISDRTLRNKLNRPKS
jgi:DNA-binding NtrC family response regulator